MSWIEALADRWQQWHAGPTDYRRVVRRLIKLHGFAKAMDVAVGGADSFGDREFIVLDHFGLRDGHYVIDVGCGSGRLTRRVALLPQSRYLGTDVSKPLLGHARATCGRADFRFALVSGLEIPERDNAADFVVFFSVGTHLPNEQFYVYLEEAKRVLRPGGRVVLSFLDLDVGEVSEVFGRMVSDAREGIAAAPPNVFFNPAMVLTWARMLGLQCVSIVSGDDARWAPSDRIAALLGGDRPARAFGQSIAVLEKIKI